MAWHADVSCSSLLFADPASPAMVRAPFMQKTYLKATIEEVHKARWDPVSCQLRRPPRGGPGFESTVLDRMREKFGAAAVANMLPSDVTNAKTSFWSGVRAGGLKGLGAGSGWPGYGSHLPVCYMYHAARYVACLPACSRACVVRLSSRPLVSAHLPACLPACLPVSTFTVDCVVACRLRPLCR